MKIIQMQQNFWLNEAIYVMRFTLILFATTSGQTECEDGIHSCTDRENCFQLNTGNQRFTLKRLKPNISDETYFH